MLISEIKIGSRHRTDLGDIAGLAASMGTLGLLQPIVIDADGGLVAGQRRIEAARLLGWTEIATTTAKTLDDVHKALMAERDENTCRKNFSPTEAAAMAEALEPFEKKAAADRTREAGKIGGEKKGSEKFTNPSIGRAADKVAEAVGMSRPTLDKARAVVHAAKADPEHYGDLPKKMDAARKVDPVHRELLERAEKFPIPDGPTPAQIARNSPAVRFTKNIHECWVVFNGIRDNGGIERLASTWTDDERRNYVTELKQFRDTASGWIATLEKPCRAKKSA